ncbi:methoxy mycolic acid synthase 1 [Beauveria brongniartii RCEF 3172]|uniref:Methoxy mycolic acid synthase 1 n=1 Tax=Beauveria brongniartii RCEF 3172 TaxID=1081107 RepID=A0A162M5C2_9HYPO|nr:methoxy mycolic acid synthase 1 [Beauveria brongniartii RCEF 3172]
MVSFPSLPAAVTGPATRAVEATRGAIGGFTWKPALAVARPAILSILSRIEFGTLLLVDEPAGTRHIFGQKLDGTTDLSNVEASATRRATTLPRVELIVKNDAFWMRLFLFGDMGFAEAYMLGDFECQDLTSFFQLFIVNRDYLGNGTTWISSVSAAISALARANNALGSALLNISAHYDISNDMFAAFLSPDMTYSCAVWDRLSDIANTDTKESLETAQLRKLHRFIDGCKLKSDDHVLEIGTGWGSFAIEAVSKSGCHVTSLTLSKEQKALAEDRIAAAGLRERITVMLCDYRELELPEGKRFDKIVSIEMLEAVGREFLATYFGCIDRLLKEDGGVAMFQCITMPECRCEAYAKSEDFISHYIFPGGYLPSATELLNHITTQSKGTLIVENIENIGGHYARTLRLWREQFMGAFESKIRPALLKQHPDMTKEAVNVFKRKWEYYFTYCEAGFITKTLGDVIITVGRERTLELMEGVPL